MARDHARMKLSIWDDEDWCNLTVAAQHAYWTLATQKRLSYCGVLDYIPSRLTVGASDLTEPKVTGAVKQLEKTRFVLVDRTTQELLVRTYVRHDGLFDRTNMGKAVANAFGRVVSKRLRDAILMELGRHYCETPHLKGWGGFREIDPVAFDMASAMSSTIPLPIASGGE